MGARGLEQVGLTLAESSRWGVGFGAQFRGVDSARTSYKVVSVGQSTFEGFNGSASIRPLLEGS